MYTQKESYRSYTLSKNSISCTRYTRHSKLFFFGVLGLLLFGLIHPVLASTIQAQPISIQMATLIPIIRTDAISPANSALQTFSGWTTIFSEGFETTFPYTGWSVSGDPTWDEDSYLPHNGSWSAWCANGGSLGTYPSISNYTSNMDAIMTYGPFSITSCSNAQLSFYLWNISETDHDYVYYSISTDGSNFYGYNESGTSGGWVYRNLDFSTIPTLGDIRGYEQVWMQYRFTSDGANNYQGAFIDDISIQKYLDNLPNLVPYAISGWSDKLVIGPAPNQTEGPVYSRLTSYLSWGAINDSDYATKTTVYFHVYDNGINIGSWWVGNTTMAANQTVGAWDTPYVFNSYGWHTIQLIVDVTKLNLESIESDNSYSRIIYVAELPPEINVSPASISKTIIQGSTLYDTITISNTAIVDTTLNWVISESVSNTDVSNSWSILSSMTVTRSRPAAATVNGKIYIFGGEGSGGYANVVERYDPITKIWTTMANKPTGISNVCCGAIGTKIYVPGGYTGSYISTLEIYDTQYDSWTTGAAMPQALCGAAAAVVNNKFYVFGGTNNGSYFNTAYVYDPTLDSWSTLSLMNYARAYAGAVAVNNKIYVIGGRDASTNDFKYCEEYDIASGTWSTKSSMNTARGGVGVCAVDGLIYALGGGWYSNYNSCEQYNPITNIWTMSTALVPNLNYGRRTFGIATVDKTIYALGGWNGSYMNAVESYNTDPLDWLDETPRFGSIVTGDSTPVTLTFDATSLPVGDTTGYILITSNDTANSPTIIPVTLHVVTPEIDILPTYIGKTVAQGGTTYSYMTIKSMSEAPLQYEIAEQAASLSSLWLKPQSAFQPEAIINKYENDNPTTDSGLSTGKPTVSFSSLTRSGGWAMESSMTGTRSRPAAATVNGKIYVIGGEGSGGYTIVERYDPITKIWTTMANKPTGISNVCCGAIGTKIYVPGGYIGSGSISNLEIYDTQYDSWTTGASMPQALFGAAAAVVNNKLYVFGGTPDSYSYFNTAYVYDPALDSWSTLSSMNYARAWAGAAAVNNKIYVIGGLDYSTLDFAYCEEYDITSGTWSIKSSMNVARGGVGVCAVDGFIYAVGGGWTGYYYTCERYNPVTNIWTMSTTLIPELNGGRRTFAITTVNKTIYALGGWNGSYLSSVESYNTDKLDWLDETPKSAIVAGTSYSIVTIKFSAASLPLGDTTGYLIVTSNDTDESQITIPVFVHCISDTIKPVSAAGSISPYWRKSTPISVPYNASDNGELSSITLYYRYQPGDSTTWSSWSSFQTVYTSKMTTGGTFSFTAPRGQGKYEFYTRAKDWANQTESAPSTADAACGYDKTPPTVGTISINTGATYTQSTVVWVRWAGASDTFGVASVGISNTSGSGYVWSKYTTANGRTWNVTAGEGTKTVYEVFVDNAGNQSVQTTDTIILTASRILTIQSSPQVGTYIVVSPKDYNGQSSDYTNFLRNYNRGTTVNLYAPQYADGHRFIRWTKNNVSYSTNTNITLTMDSSYQVMAEYTLNRYGTFNASSDTSYWYWEKYGDGTAAGTLSRVTGYGSKTGVARFYQKPGEKGKLTQIYSVLSTGWYTAKANVATDVSTMSKRQKVYLYLQEFDSATAVAATGNLVIQSGNGGLPSAGTWKSTEISFYAQHTLLGVQLVGINPTSSGVTSSLYLDDIWVYPGAAVLTTKKSITNSSFTSGTAGWSIELYADGTGPGTWSALSSWASHTAVLKSVQLGGQKGKASQTYSGSTSKTYGSVWVYSSATSMSNTQKIYLYIYSYDSSYSKIVESGNAILQSGKWTPGTWRQLQFEYTPFSTKNAVQIVGINPSGKPTGTLYFDEVELKQ